MVSARSQPRSAGALQGLWPPILKGEQRYTFFYDFTGSRSWTTFESNIIWRTAPGLYQSEEAMENLIQEEINDLASLNFRFISCGLSDAENERRIELSLRDAMSQLPSA